MLLTALFLPVSPPPILQMTTQELLLCEYTQPRGFIQVDSPSWIHFWLCLLFQEEQFECKSQRQECEAQELQLEAEKGTY